MAIHSERDINKKLDEIRPSFLEGIGILCLMVFRFSKRTISGFLSVSKVLDAKFKIQTVEDNQKSEPREEGKIT